MDAPLHYQVSEYDCVPTTFLNAVAYLFPRRSIPPLVVRHIYAYSLDTVSRAGRIGRGGTSRYAIQLLGHWLGSYKTHKFSVATEYLAPQELHAGEGSRIIAALAEGGVALCNVYLGHQERHFLLLLRVDEDRLHAFDPYRRKVLRGLGGKVRRIRRAAGREPNLMISREWLQGAGTEERFTFGELAKRECLLMWRTR